MIEIGEGKLEYENIIGPEKTPHSEAFNVSCLLKGRSNILITDSKYRGKDSRY